MSNTVSTNNAGESNPNAQKYRKNNAVAAFIITAVLFPFVIISAWGTWLTFSYLKIRRSVILLFLALYMIVFGWLITLVSIPYLVNNTIPIIRETLNGDANWLDLVFLTGNNVLVGIPIGVIVGLIYASWRWFRRPLWQKYDFKPAPWEIWKGRKTAKQIQQDINTPFDGLTLGVNDKGERLVQTDSAAAAHTLVVGASGSGKTTTLMSKARDAVKRGHGLIFVDLKGGKDVPQVLYDYAQRYGREFKHWLIQPLDTEYTGPDPRGPACYDPLSRGDATRRKDLLVASRQWSEEFYKIEASNYLQLLFHTIILNPQPEMSTLSDVVSMLSPQALLNRAEKLMENNPEYRDILSGIEALNDPRISQAKRNAIEGLRSQLEVILNSAAGRWLLVDPKGNNIKIKQAAHEGQIIVFSLDSSNYPELAGLVANLIIQDLKTASSELRDEPASTPTQIFIDEFSAIGSENIIGLINKSRDAGLPVTLSTQALGDLRRVNESFLDQLLGIINSFIIHRANKDDDAQVYAGLTGVEKKFRFAQTVEMTVGRFGGIGRGAGTGGGRVEEYEDFTVSPNEIQELDMGEIIYVTKSPNMIDKATVVPEKFTEDAIKDDKEIEYHNAWEYEQKRDNKIDSSITTTETQSDVPPVLAYDADNDASKATIEKPGRISAVQVETEEMPEEELMQSYQDFIKNKNSIQTDREVEEQLSQSPKTAETKGTLPLPPKGKTLPSKPKPIVSDGESQKDEFSF